MVSTSYSVYYTFQVAIPVIYDEMYHYSYFEVGLTFLPGLAGMTIGGIVAGRLVDRNFAKVARKNNIALDSRKAEDLKEFPIEDARYRHIIYFVAFEVVSVIGYGWVIMFRVHPAVPLVIQFFVCRGVHLAQSHGKRPARRYLSE
jgi:MFS family permease